MSKHPDAHIAETDEIAAELERAGLLTVTTREDGEPMYTLTRRANRSRDRWR